MTGMSVVRTKSGWAVSGGQPYYLKETKTRREAENWIAWAEQVRADTASHDQRRAEWLEDLLESRGLEQVDYRTIRPGDRYTSDPTGPIRTVTKVEHMPSGASMIYHPEEHMPNGSLDRFTLHVRSIPAFRLQPDQNRGEGDRR